MSDLYDNDALAWSEQQGGLLRRLAQGERLNAAIDWPNVIEEIEAMGRSELHACGSHLEQAMFHLLKLQAWPGSRAAPHWRHEVRVFLGSARDAFTPSMRARLDLARRYELALRSLHYAAEEHDAPPLPTPATCPFVLDDLLADAPDVTLLLAKSRMPHAP